MASDFTCVERSFEKTGPWNPEVQEEKRARQPAWNVLEQDRPGGPGGPKPGRQKAEDSVVCDCET